MADLIQSDAYGIEQWITEVGWPSENSDTIEALQLYQEWAELYPRNQITGVPDGDILINHISQRMHHIHSNRDATFIVPLLILKISSLVRMEGILPRS